MTSITALQYELVTQNLPRSSGETVAAVVGILLKPAHFHEVAVVGSVFLRNRRLRRVLGNQPFRLLADRNAVPVSDWVRACHSEGHLSAWFLPNDPSELEAEIATVVELGPPVGVQIGAEGGEGPLAESQRDTFESLVASGVMRDGIAYCFTHDGAQMFRVG